MMAGGRPRDGDAIFFLPPDAARRRPLDINIRRFRR